MKHMQCRNNAHTFDIHKLCLTYQEASNMICSEMNVPLDIIYHATSQHIGLSVRL